MTNFNYFTGYFKVEEVKKRFRDLAKQHHPDKNNNSPESTEIFKTIMNQYHSTLKAMSGQESTDRKTRKTHTYYYKRETEQAIIDKINEILSIDGVYLIMLVGTWIWLTGETKAIEDELTSIGMRWSTKRMMWSWHKPTGRKRRSYCKGGFETITARYGYKEYSNDSGSSQTDWCPATSQFSEVLM